MSRVILIFIFFFNYSFCFAQQDQSNNVSQSENASGLLPEKILVHSDKNFYISGEIMWFKIYVVEADSYRLQSLSRTAYTELIDQDGKPILQAKIELIKGAGSGSFSIPLNAKSGSYQLRVYTNWMKNNPSSIFNKAITIINTQNTFDTTAFILSSNGPDDESGKSFSKEKTSPNNKNSKFSHFDIQVRSDKNTYQRRSPVEIAISPSTNSGINANLSVAVYKLHDLNMPDGFGDNEKSSANIAGGTNQIASDYPFIPEMQGYVVRIKVKTVKTGQMAEGIPVILSLTGKLANVQYGESDAEGMVYFNLEHVYGPQQLFIKTTPEYENVVDLELSKPYLNITNTSIQQKPIIKNEFLNAVEEMHNNLAITQAFITDSIDQFYTIVDRTSFYGTPYFTYLLDNYKRFVTMEEVLREYVKEVMVRIRNKNYYVLVFNRQLYDLRKYIDYAKNMMDDNGPLVLIDGIPVTDLNKLIKYDPLKVRKLELIADRYVVGGLIYDGILSFTTYKGEFENLELNKKELLFDDEGWQRQRKFYMPDYKDPLVKKSRIPDFRELLYWAPTVKISKTNSGKISFFTGDVTGKFVVVVKGVSDDGRLVNEMVPFEVKK
jgi:hypothetical protein